jgi:hypothetical protein
MATLLTSRGQETRGDEEVKESFTSSHIGREESPSIHSTLEAPFSSMSSIQLSQNPACQNRLHLDRAPPKQLERTRLEEQNITILHYLVYTFIACFLDHLLERLILILQRHVHRVPILLRFKFVKALVKVSADDLYASTLYRTQNILKYILANEVAIETLSPVRIVKTISFREPSEDWGHFADFQEEMAY